MLDPWIIEEIRRREEEQRQRDENQRGQLEIHIETPDDRDRSAVRRESPQPKVDRGIAIISFGF